MQCHSVTMVIRCYGIHHSSVAANIKPYSQFVCLKDRMLNHDLHDGDERPKSLVLIVAGRWSSSICLYIMMGKWRYIEAKESKLVKSVEKRGCLHSGSLRRSIFAFTSLPISLTIELERKEPTHFLSVPQLPEQLMFHVWITRYNKSRAKHTLSEHRHGDAANRKWCYALRSNGAAFRWAGGKSVKQFHDFMHARFVTVLCMSPKWEFEHNQIAIILV